MGTVVISFCVWDKLSDIVKSLEEKKVSLQQDKENIKQQVTFTFLKLTDLDNLHRRVLKKFAGSSLGYFFFLFFLKLICTVLVSCI